MDDADEICVVTIVLVIPPIINITHYAPLKCHYSLPVAVEVVVGITVIEEVEDIGIDVDIEV